jgi:hypothetical protein
VVVTHRVPENWVRGRPDAPLTFVTDGLPRAIERARQIAGEKNVRVTARSSPARASSWDSSAYLPVAHLHSTVNAVRMPIA